MFSIPTINSKKDLKGFDSIYILLKNCEVVYVPDLYNENIQTLTMRWEGGLTRVIRKENLLRVLVPYGCYIKKWLMQNKGS